MNQKGLWLTINRPIIVRQSFQTPSAWYSSIDMAASFEPAHLVPLNELIKRVQEVKLKPKKHERYAEATRLRPLLHGLEVSPNLSGVIIKKSKLVEPGGLPDIFESGDVAYPNDVRLDCFELYKNW